MDTSRGLTYLSSCIGYILRYDCRNWKWVATPGQTDRHECRNSYVDLLSIGMYCSEIDNLVKLDLIFTMKQLLLTLIRNWDRNWTSNHLIFIPGFKFTPPGFSRVQHRSWRIQKLCLRNDSFYTEKSSFPTATGPIFEVWNKICLPNSHKKFEIFLFSHDINWNSMIQSWEVYKV